LKKNILIDAGPLIALFDKDDKYHSAVKIFLGNIKGYLISTWPVLTEATHMLSFNVNAQLDLLKWLQRGGISLFQLSKEHILSFITLTEKYADIPIDLADASLIIAATELHINEIISIDSDFDIYRTLKKDYVKNIFDKAQFLPG
jgi:predicted nucleic acid-binding protein